MEIQFKLGVWDILDVLGRLTLKRGSITFILLRSTVLHSARICSVWGLISLISLSNGCLLLEWRIGFLLKFLRWSKWQVPNFLIGFCRGGIHNRANWLAHIAKKILDCAVEFHHALATLSPLFKLLTDRLWLVSDDGSLEIVDGDERTIFTEISFDLVKNV